MASFWDSEEIKIEQKKKVDKWEGEDDDDENIRDNWDDEENNDEKEESKSKIIEVEIKAVQAKKKKNLKDKLAKKQQKEIEEQAARKKQELEEKKTFTPKQIHEEKMRRQKIQEEADLTLAIEAFGLSSATDLLKGDIDKFDPTTKEDFEELSRLLTSKILKYQSSPFYNSFLESLLQDLILPLETEGLNKLSSGLTTLYNEKLKQQKATKTKKKISKNVNNDDESMRGRNVLNEFADYI